MLATRHDDDLVTVLYATFTFGPTNLFGCFGGDILQFKFEIHPNKRKLHVHLCSIQISLGVKPGTCLRTNYHKTIN